MFVLDSNVLSEVMREHPEPAVLHWMDRQPVTELWTTATCEAEIRFGIAALPAGRRSEDLRRAANRVFRGFLRGRILPFDSEAAQRFAVLVVDRRRAGHQMSMGDAQIAAVAACHGATLATRDTRDFHACGIRVINPWETA